jgi:signal transduction histidine kinase
MRWFSLRTRLLLAYAGLIILGFGGLALLAGRQIETSAREDFGETVEAQTLLVARGLVEPIEEFKEGTIRQADVADVVDAFASQVDAHIILVDLSGRPWLDSAGLPPLDNFLTYPEVVAALDERVIHEIRPDDDGNETYFAAAPVVHDGEIMTVVRVAKPVSGVNVAIRQRWGVLGAGVLALTLVALAASILLSTSLTNPLTQLRNSALRLSEGDFSKRLPDNRRDEFGQLATTFNYMAGQIESMIEEQRAFAANAAHELRTPLTTIRLRSEALQQGQLDEALRDQYIAEIDREVRRLAGLVDDLILLSRIESGRAELGREQIDLSRFARSLIREFEPLAEAKCTTLTLDAPAGLPPLRASLNHLRVVFRNLLDNALKYTPEGESVTWTVREGEGCLCATIVDTGRGIDADDLPHLFQRFYRADKAHTRATLGTGLGLSLVRSIVELYGGEITLGSPGIGKGTTVTVRWPTEPGDELSRASKP